MEDAGTFSHMIGAKGGITVSYYKLEHVEAVNSDPGPGI